MAGQKHLTSPRVGFAVVPFVIVFLFAATGAAAQTNLAVIDVEKILSGSQKGQAMLTEVQAFAATKKTMLEAQQEEINKLQKRYEDGRFSLAEDVLADLQKEYEDLAIALKRAADDAEREVQEMQQKGFADIEKAILPIIDAIGKEKGYAMIFNKYQSGLVYADDSVDITADVIARYDAADNE